MLVCSMNLCKTTKSNGICLVLAFVWFYSFKPTLTYLSHWFANGRFANIWNLFSRLQCHSIWYCLSLPFQCCVLTQCHLSFVTVALDWSHCISNVNRFFLHWCLQLVQRITRNWPELVATMLRSNWLFRYSEVSTIIQWQKQRGYPWFLSKPKGGTLGVFTGL